MQGVKLRIVVFVIGLINIVPGFSQTSSKVESVLDFQRTINEEYKDPGESPLSKEDRASFESLDFFKIDTNYVVTAEFVRTPYESPFAMPTTKERTPIYVKYGELYFQLKGKKYTLNVYKSQDLLKKPEYADYLFLPFTDESNGISTYGGGRYIDLKLPLGKTVELDFNKAYNPYCAYSKNYSCPIPPKENDLKTSIPVGVRYDKKKFSH